MASPLSDLDELVLKCRDQKAKSYIKEAVACYKVGSFRSAIVSTWVAVSFDIIYKLKELSLAGDKEAEQQINKLDKARMSGDIAQALKFEREMLSICNDKFELISPIELVDLNRLQDDRNRCAHPSMTADGEIYTPSAEQARVHIRSAVEHLLQHPPAQGKYALDILCSKIDSEYFPTDPSKAEVVLESSPLKRARDSLIRNLIIVLLKKLINETTTTKQVNQISTALNVTKQMHPSRYSNTLEENISSIIRKLDDEKFDRVITIIDKVEDGWLYLADDVKQRVQSFVKLLPQNKLYCINLFLSIDDLKDASVERLKDATREELMNASFTEGTPQLCDRIIELYSKSDSFADANSFAPTVIRYSEYYSKAQILKVIKFCKENNQIEGSNKKDEVIKALKQNKNLTYDEIDKYFLE